MASDAQSSDEQPAYLTPLEPERLRASRELRAGGPTQMKVPADLRETVPGASRFAQPVHESSRPWAPT